ncbi:MAG: DUF350 domain-containing protein, partial [Planctomycetaceae bacterium]|nr:DUF350 domain-containing protein [Planctomycetaceae bacterium]
MWTDLMFAAAFGGVGIVMAVIGYFVFDLAEFRINFADEIKKDNRSAAIVVAAFIAGVC